MSEQGNQAIATRPPVGAWVWENSAFDNPHDTVNLARSIGLDFLQLMVNTKPSPNGSFELPYADKVTTLAKAAQDSSTGRALSIGLTSWINPGRNFITDAAQALIPLCHNPDVNATSLLWDAEDPWQHGTGMSHDSAARLVAEQFSDLTCPMGVTSYASRPDWTTSLAEQCSIGGPQAYSPDMKIVPGEGQRHYVTTWSSVKGPNGSPIEIIMGLGAYDQGLSRDLVVDNMKTAFEASVALAPQSICYWSIEWLAGNSVFEQSNNELAREVLTELLTGASAPSGGGNGGSSGKGGASHRVEPNDTLSKIAAAHGVTLAALLHANPQVKDPNLILIGEVINLP